MKIARLPRKIAAAPPCAARAAISRDTLIRVTPLLMRCLICRAAGAVYAAHDDTLCACALPCHAPRHCCCLSYATLMLLLLRRAITPCHCRHIPACGARVPISPPPLLIRCAVAYASRNGMRVARYGAMLIRVEGAQGTLMPRRWCRCLTQRMYACASLIKDDVCCAGKEAAVMLARSARYLR